MEVNIKVEGLGRVKKTLNTLKDKVENTEPLMAELSNYLYNVVEDSFENQSSPDGKTWSPIKKTGRIKKGGSQKILYKTGDMQNSLGRDYTKDKAIVGLNAISDGYPYPLVHQFGTDKAGRNKNTTIDERPFMPIKSDGSIYDNTKEDIIEIVEDYIKESVK